MSSVFRSNIIFIGKRELNVSISMGIIVQQKRHGVSHGTMANPIAAQIVFLKDQKKVIQYDT